MNKVSDILLRKGTTAIVVSPTTSVFEALQLMAEKNIGSVVVLDDKQYLGVMTERDYSRKVALKNKQSTTTVVAEIMTVDLPYIHPTDTVDECMEMMTVNNIRYLPVFEDDRFITIVSMSDVVKQTILAQQQTINNLNNYLYS